MRNWASTASRRCRRVAAPRSPGGRTRTRSRRSSRCGWPRTSPGPPRPWTGRPPRARTPSHWTRSDAYCCPRCGTGHKTPPPQRRRPPFSGPWAAAPRPVRWPERTGPPECAPASTDASHPAGTPSTRPRLTPPVLLLHDRPGRPARVLLPAPGETWASATEGSCGERTGVTAAACIPCPAVVRPGRRTHSASPGAPSTCTGQQGARLQRECSCSTWDCWQTGSVWRPSL